MTTNARTDPETGLRFYTWQGRDYPSVTSIRRLVGMPFTLHNYALGKVIDRAVDQHDKIGDMLSRPRRPRERVQRANIIKEVRKYLRQAATEERDLAGDRGTRIHDQIARNVPLAQTDPDTMGFVAQYLDFLATQKPTVLWQERQVWNLTYGYAGTGDILLLLADGRTAVVDLKSSQGVYLDHAVQLIAYSMGEFVGENDVIDPVATQQLRDAEVMAVLHLTETGWEFIELKSTNELFAGFVGSLAFARFLHDHQNSIESLVAQRTTGGTLVPILTASINAQGGTDTDG